MRSALSSAYPVEPRGNHARHLNTMAAMICGMVAAKRANLPEMAGKVPADKGTGCTSKPESRVKSFTRWVKNQGIDAETYFLPYAQILVRSLAHLPLHLVIDGSCVGRGCMTLMVGLVYKKRALPLVWIVAKKKKGHFPEQVHLELIRQVERLVPAQARVILLGDGEFDGIDLQGLVNGWKWDYVLRTAKSIHLCWQGRQFTYAQVVRHIRPGEAIDLSDALFTKQQYGPILAITWWRQDCKEPIYLVSNMKDADQACVAYSKRFRIETFFSDQKSRGFHLQKSHLSDPERLSRLMIPACLAYYWVIYLGAYAIEYGWDKIVHRTERCDLSLFTLGLRLLDHLLGEGMAVAVAFTVPS